MVLEPVLVRGDARMRPQARCFCSARSTANPVVPEGSRMYLEAGGT